MFWTVFIAIVAALIFFFYVLPAIPYILSYIWDNIKIFGLITCGLAFLVICIVYWENEYVQNFVYGSIALVVLGGWLLSSSD